jgi:CheY-like chemotaxis protein
MDGYEAAQIIRSREQTKRIPIVFLSAVNKEAEHLLRGYSMGAVDYVFKPVERSCSAPRSRCSSICSP